MFLVRIGPRGHERPALVDQDGSYRDISTLVDDLGPTGVSDMALARILRHDIASLPVLRAGTRLGPCVRVGACFQIDANTSARAAELRVTTLNTPLMLETGTVHVSGVDDMFDTRELDGCHVGDVGVELGVVVGARAESVSVEDARACIAGYCLVTQVSRRDYLSDQAGNVVVGSSESSRLFLGPRFLTWDEGSRALAADLRLQLNGELVQHLPIRYLRFDPPALIHHISQHTALEPGDLICTGRPELLHGPSRFPQLLRRGDLLTASAGALGSANVRIH